MSFPLSIDYPLPRYRIAFHHITSFNLSQGKDTDKDQKDKKDKDKKDNKDTKDANKDNKDKDKDKDKDKAAARFDKVTIKAYPSLIVNCSISDHCTSGINDYGMIQFG